MSVVERRNESREERKKTRRIINEIFRLEGDGDYDDEDDLATKLGVLYDLVVEEVEVNDM